MGDDARAPSAPDGDGPAVIAAAATVACFALAALLAFLIERYSR